MEQINVSDVGGAVYSRRSLVYKSENYGGSRVRPPWCTTKNGVQISFDLFYDKIKCLLVFQY